MIDLGQQRRDEIDLAADLGPAEHRHERPLGPEQRLTQVAELLLHQEAGHRGLEYPGDGLGAGMGAVGRAEGVVDIEVAQRREARGQLLVVLLFAGEEPSVLGDRDAAPGDPSGLGDGLLGSGSLRNVTGEPSTRSTSRTTGSIEYFGSGPPLGRRDARAAPAARRGSGGTRWSAAPRGSACYP